MSSRMPATGTLLLLVAIWILINLFFGDLPKLVMGKAGISFSPSTPTPNPVPNFAPNPTPNPLPEPSFNPTPNLGPDPGIPGIGPVEGDTGGGNSGCPQGYMNVFGMCIPITTVPKRNPPPLNPNPGFNPLTHGFLS